MEPPDRFLIPRSAEMHVVNDAVFHPVVAGMRKRADRATRPLLLTVVSLAGGRDPGPPGLWDAAVEALTGVAGDTDMLGWLEWQAALGLIMPDVGPEDLGRTRAAVAAAVRSGLEARLDADALAGVRVHVDVHPAPGGSDTADGLAAWHRSDLGPRGTATPSAPRAKRAFDLVVSGTLLVLLSPLLAMIAVLVKYHSPGPALFRQTRVGRMMKPFTLLKFRTMRVGADPGIHREFVSRFINSDSGHADTTAADVQVPFKLTDDPRVTPVGRWLRRTSLDELPQLWNVLRGDMSLVGPRPPLAYELDQYKPWHRRRVLEATPGITGLWQVTGRSQTTFDEMVRLDLRYARTRSFWTDLKILLATPAAVISGKGAR